MSVMGLMLQWTGSYSDIGSILQHWADLGVFMYILPFLLIFAIIFGILSATNILGGNKGVHAIIAFAAALLSLQFEFVPAFFAEIFPRLGVAISIILVLMILAGLFIDPEEKGWLTAFAVIGIIIAIIVIVSSFSSETYWWGSNFWQDYGEAIIIGAIVIAIIGTIIATSYSKSNSGKSGKRKGPLIRFRQDD